MRLSTHTLSPGLMSSLLQLDSFALLTWNLYVVFCPDSYHFAYRYYPPALNHLSACYFLVYWFGFLYSLSVLVHCRIVFLKLIICGGFWNIRCWFQACLSVVGILYPNALARGCFYWQGGSMDGVAGFLL